MRCQLVLVDDQARLMPAIHDARSIMQRALVLAGAANELGVPTL